MLELKKKIHLDLPFLGFWSLLFFNQILIDKKLNIKNHIKVVQ